jgi:antitoxin component YwqK of YwqJK toxin-antitoxin module
MRKIKFKDGLKHGLERVWLEDGTLGRKTRYKDGLAQSNPLVGLGWVEWTELP